MITSETNTRVRDGEEVIRDLKKAVVCLREDMSENTHASPPLPVSRLSAGRIEEEVIPPTSRRVERGLAPLPDEHHTHARCDRRCFLRPRRPSGLPSNALVPVVFIDRKLSFIRNKTNFTQRRAL